MVVYVLDLNGNPLMPTRRFGKVRRLLNSKQAKVVRRKPFTIKLLYETETHVVQDCTLGVDTGSANIVLIAGVIALIGAGLLVFKVKKA